MTNDFSIVSCHVRVNENTVASGQSIMTADYPAEKLGLLVAAVMTKAFECGFDPVVGHVILHFNEG